MNFDAESLLNSLEPIGWKLGLERMNLLCDELGRPQDRFGTIHVVGTNGKSSVARMSAALLSAHGLRAGCLVSPHLTQWSERVLVDGVELDPGTGFAGSVERAAAVAERVNDRLGPATKSPSSNSRSLRASSRWPRPESRWQRSKRGSVADLTPPTRSIPR